MPTLVSLDQVKRRVGENPSDPSPDVDLTRLIGVAVGELKAITGGPLFTETITDEYVYCDDDRTLILMQRPVVAVTTITSEWTGLAVSYSDLTVNSRSGIVRRRNGLRLLGWTDAYLVTYTAGWGASAADNPDAFAAFTEAALVIVAHLWEIQRGPTASGAGWTEGTMAVPGMAYAVPNRALEIVRPYSREVYV